MRLVNALALEADEGRVLNHDSVGKTSSSRYNRQFPNGKTPPDESLVIPLLAGKELGELKHLSNRRKRDLLVFR
jgi:hypothetical protein